MTLHWFRGGWSHINIAPQKTWKNNCETIIYWWYIDDVLGNILEEGGIYWSKYGL